ICSDASARAISRMMRNSSNGSIEPTIRSSSAYFRLLKWKPPRSSSASSSATICSTLVPWGWWPVSTSTCACGPSRRQTSAAVPAMPECLRAHRGVGMAEASEPVGVVAEQVGVDRADPDSLRLGVAAEPCVVVHGVPWDVQRQTRAAAGQTVHERRVVDPLAHVARGARPRVDVETRAGVAVAPGGGLDLESPEALENLALVHGAAV